MRLSHCPYITKDEVMQHEGPKMPRKTTKPARKTSAATAKAAKGRAASAKRTKKAA